MLLFLIKGIFRDSHRWLFPILIVAVGVVILIFTLSFTEGYKDSFVRQNARFDTGHVKVVTRAYAEMLGQKPYDLALLDIEEELKTWKKAYPQLDWAQRISFGALLDVPDANGETKAQGEVLGFAVDLFANDSEIKHLNLNKALIAGRIPQKPGEVLLSKDAFERLSIKLGDNVTLIGGTVYGGMSFQNFVVVGSVFFGVQALDKGAVIADISDIRILLDMQGGAGEILGFYKNGRFNAKDATRLAEDFNTRFSDVEDEFSPQMLTMMQQNNLGYLMQVFSQTMNWMGAAFVFILGIVLWNSGLMNGIRRYGEFGVRLAIGESKPRVYGSLLLESLVVGIVGSVIGLVVGLAISIYFNYHGMDVAAYNRNSSILSENVIYTFVTPIVVIASFVPGVLSTLFGAALAGAAIFKRQTSQLFKELEV